MHRQTARHHAVARALLGRGGHGPQRRLPRALRRHRRRRDGGARAGKGTGFSERRCQAHSGLPSGGQHPLHDRRRGRRGQRLRHRQEDRGGHRHQPARDGARPHPARRLAHRARPRDGHAHGLPGRHGLCRGARQLHHRHAGGLGRGDPHRRGAADEKIAADGSLPDHGDHAARRRGASLRQAQRNGAGVDPAPFFCFCAQVARIETSPERRASSPPSS